MTNGPYKGKNKICSVDLGEWKTVRQELIKFHCLIVPSQLPMYEHQYTRESSNKYYLHTAERFVKKPHVTDKIKSLNHSTELQK